MLGMCAGIVLYNFSPCYPGYFFDRIINGYIQVFKFKYANIVRRRPSDNIALICCIFRNVNLFMIDRIKNRANQANNNYYKRYPNRDMDIKIFYQHLTTDKYQHYCNTLL